MSGKWLYVPFLFSLCIIGSSPHLPMPAAVAQDEGALRVRVDVDMVTIEVTALDRRDNPVPGLKMEDFELYEDGKKQDIVSLEEIVAESGSSALGASPIAGRSAAVLLARASDCTLSHTCRLTERFPMATLFPYLETL